MFSDPRSLGAPRLARPPDRACQGRDAVLQVREVEVHDLDGEGVLLVPLHRDSEVGPAVGHRDEIEGNGFGGACLRVRLRNHSSASRRSREGRKGAKGGRGRERQKEECRMQKDLTWRIRYTINGSVPLGVKVEKDEGLYQRQADGSLRRISPQSVVN